MAGSQCEARGGQCNCQPGVVGRTCNSCVNGFYGFSSAGCQCKEIVMLILCYIYILITCEITLFDVTSIEALKWCGFSKILA